MEYNNSIHRTIDMKPANVSKDDEHRLKMIFSGEQEETNKTKVQSRRES